MAWLRKQAGSEQIVPGRQYAVRESAFPQSAHGRLIVGYVELKPKKTADGKNQPPEQDWNAKFYDIIESKTKPGTAEPRARTWAVQPPEAGPSKYKPKFEGEVKGDPEAERKFSSVIIWMPFVLTVCTEHKLMSKNHKYCWYGENAPLGNGGQNCFQHVDALLAALKGKK